jgi:hypothetical protein
LIKKKVIDDSCLADRHHTLHLYGLTLREAHDGGEHVELWEWLDALSVNAIAHGKL